MTGRDLTRMFNGESAKAVRMAKKPKARRMRVILSCDGKCRAEHSFEYSWNEPEEKWADTYHKFYDSLQVLLKAHGLMKDSAKPGRNE